MSKILVITGDGGESYETLYAVHRFQEEGWTPVVAAPSRRRLNLVIHDFEPGWDTYIERHGYGLAADLAFEEVRAGDYAAGYHVDRSDRDYRRGQLHADHQRLFSR